MLKFLSSIVVLLFLSFIGLYAREKAKSVEQEEVSLNEDLMREHGILNRLLLIYQEIAGRIEKKQDFPMDSLVKSATLMRDFIENYHEKLEEDYIFPRFEKAGQLTDLVRTLRRQHEAGRKITDYILAHANEKSLKDPSQQESIALYLSLYIRMFRPHEAREDTVLFPALHQLISREEYEKLGDKFEEIEHQQFGEDGFERAVHKVAEIEKQLGIYNLSQFTAQN